MNEQTRPVPAYDSLVNRIGETLAQGRGRAIKAVNIELVRTYWEIGRHIVEYEQDGAGRAVYGANLLDRLSRDLSVKYGRGFSRSNLIYIRKLYLLNPISETLSHELSFGHYFELLKIEDPLERNFYSKQSENENWSVRELKRQVASSLFQRLVLSRDKKEVLKLSQSGLIVEKPADLVRDPFVLEFLNLPERAEWNETELERKLVEQLQKFLLELGKGFALIGRQYRISIAGRHHYVDLVFYHRVLKCFVLIDLKAGTAVHEDVGQMNFYLNYFQKEENAEGDNPPVGIILAAQKDDVTMEYAMGRISNAIFVSRYQLWLPDRETLRRQMLLWLH